ncbi:hypothetical protein [Nannocystis bainbridge]|uniref:VWFA domain-containing protein n=1 Tax=Nannocystis bainbridge TaxID=2995303 RepID=A0ABT5DSL0_9BACT|nr:hypothetical protein [Nannocystis bainbridge]MDC0716128.1 hypothetical protein [Nannocystis bainbridge]
MRPGFFSFAVLLGLTVACNGGDAATGFSGPSHPGVTTVPVGSSSSTDAMAESDSSSTSSTSSSGWSGSTSTGQDGPKLDMAVPDAPPMPPIGCKGKIDFLFVISAWGGMEEVQKQLSDAFPIFMKKIQDQLGEFDVRVLSASPTGAFNMDSCSNCADAEDCTYNAKPPLCKAELDACDTTLGAGVTFPAGAGSANRRCDFYGGHRYILGEDPMFEQSFACLTQVGINGAVPETAAGMVHAISFELNAPEGCNAGFLREDALLVVTLFDDGYDAFSPGTVESWAQSLRDAKHDNEDAFAVLAFSTDIDAGFGNLCNPFNPVEDVNPLRELADNVAHGHFVSICEPSYAEPFESFVDEIVMLCENLHIPQ